jgi:hypothetical protein
VILVIVNVGIGIMTTGLLVGSWAYVLWRRHVQVRAAPRDRRVWAEFVLSFILLASAIAFAGQQLVSLLLDGGVDGLRFQFLLIGMGIAAFTWAGVLEAFRLRRGR